MSYNLLKGKRGIIFGALNDQSIAWKVAERAVEEGATITLSNTPMAIRMGEVDALAQKLNCQVIPADATSVEDLQNVFKTSMDILGGQIDFVLHSIGMSPNVRKKRTYDDLDYGMLDKTLDISAVSFHKMIQSAKKLNAIADYGSIVALSYVAAQRTFYGYNVFNVSPSMIVLPKCSIPTEFNSAKAPSLSLSALPLIVACSSLFSDEIVTTPCRLILDE